MNKCRSGFMLLEAVLTVVIVSICLTFIAQALLTNYRTGVRFQETIRSLIVMENRLGILYATNAADDQLIAYPEALGKPYDQFTTSARAETVNDHLKKIGLQVQWPQGRNPGRLDVTTIVYSPDET